jgi:hypothetical protein
MSVAKSAKKSYTNLSFNLQSIDAEDEIASSQLSELN